MLTEAGSSSLGFCACFSYLPSGLPFQRNTVCTCDVHSFSLEFNFCSPKARLETRTWVGVIYSGGDPRVVLHWERDIVRKPHTAWVNEWDPGLGNRSVELPGPSERLCQAHLLIAHRGRQQLGCIFTDCHFWPIRPVQPQAHLMLPDAGQHWCHVELCVGSGVWATQGTGKLTNGHPLLLWSLTLTALH